MDHVMEQQIWVCCSCCAIVQRRQARHQSFERLSVRSLRRFDTVLVQ